MRIEVTSDEKVKQEIRAALHENGGYCPCRIEHTDDTKCMCKEFRDMIDNNIAGYCHCGLWRIIND